MSISPFPMIWLNQGEIPAAVKADFVPVLIDGHDDGLITFRELNDPVNAGLNLDHDGNGQVDGCDILDLWTDGVDDDGNGKRDDLIGWDFINNDNDPFDDHRHGTHVAGTIAAEGNNGVGIAGLNWQSSVMALKFLDDRNKGDASHALAALNYATAMRVAYLADAGSGANVRVTNNSWGGGAGFRADLYDSIKASGAADMLFVAASGNGNILGRGIDNDSLPFYPASYDLPNVIAVAATDQWDQLAPFSNYGTRSVDLAAPGVAILSTEPGDGYAMRNGTSMAAPHVTGTVALVWAKEPDATATEVKQAIMQEVDVHDPQQTGDERLKSLKRRVVTSGRLNAGASLTADTVRPRVALNDVQDIDDSGGAGQEFRVRITDTNGIKLSTLDALDLVVRRGDGSGVDITVKTPLVISVNGVYVLDAVYRMQAPGGTWDFAANGEYQIWVQPNEIADEAGNTAAPGYLGSFFVNAPNEHQLDVDSLSDAPDADPDDGTNQAAGGAKTLRSAIMHSNLDPKLNTIVLPAGVVTLSVGAAGDDSDASGDLDITDSVTIVGVKGGGTVIDAQDLDRIFDIHGDVTVTLQHVTLRGGRADAGQDGGAIRNAGDLTLRYVTIDDNRADAGGGVANRGTLSIVSSTVSRNVVDDAGGGLHNASSGQLTMTNVTVSGNQAVTGGGIANSGDLTLRAVTVADNQADGTAGGVTNAGTASVLSTIVAANAVAGTPADLSGSFTSAGNNLIGNHNGATGFSHGVKADQVGSAAAVLDPKLDALGDYEGETETHRLQFDSPAVNRGAAVAGVSTDQRGFPRQGPPDVGAFERYYVVVQGVKFHDINGDGVRDADEPGLGGWRIFLDLNEDGIWQPDEPRATTSQEPEDLGHSGWMISTRTEQAFKGSRREPTWCGKCPTPPTSKRIPAKWSSPPRCPMTWAITPARRPLPT